ILVIVWYNKSIFKAISGRMAIQTGEPLFNATFYGWKYGLILKEIRSAYKDGTFVNIIPKKFIRDCSLTLKKVLEEYAGKDSWSLSRLTHGEISWKNSRIGIPEEQNSDNPMRLEDIRADAERIKARRKMLNELGLA
ncbi:MAG: SocA family protein, partial [Acetatifactor sp.]|nr:SocA family protein [Acetatifactor sp.]